MKALFLGRQSGSAIQPANFPGKGKRSARWLSPRSGGKMEVHYEELLLWDPDHADSFVHNAEPISPS
jgi:hypothetical protein